MSKHQNLEIEKLLAWKIPHAQNPLPFSGGRGLQPISLAASGCSSLSLIIGDVLKDLVQHLCQINQLVSVNINQPISFMIFF